MKFEEARELGKKCGLSRPEEQVANVIHQADKLFLWTEIGKELEELERSTPEITWYKALRIMDGTG